MRSFLFLAACLCAPSSVLAFSTHRLGEISPRVLAAGSSNITNSSSPIAPSEDPWYTAPSEYENEKPGTILRVRPAPGNLTTITGNCSAAYNIMYRTTGSRYNPTWAVTTLFIPKNAAAGGNSSAGNSSAHHVVGRILASNSTGNSSTGNSSAGGSVLSYQMHYDSSSIDASPSYAMYAGVGPDISQALGKGWYVNVPDYEGPLASFTAGVLSGHATLDSIRSITSDNGTARFGLPANNSVALWGYSGGALASMWSAELQVQYAPNLTISGIAAGGLTPNVTSVLFAINGNLTAGLAPAAILGITNQYPEAYKLMLSMLKTSGPYNRTGFLATQNYSLAQGIIAYENQDIGDYFTGGLPLLLSNPLTSKIINNDGVMGYHGVPQMPVFVYKAVKDEVSPINDTDTLVSRFCGVGANIVYQRMSIGGHNAGESNGRAAATTFLEAALGGTLASASNSTGCTISNVAYNVSSVPF